MLAYLYSIQTKGGGPSFQGFSRAKEAVLSASSNIMYLARDEKQRLDGSSPFFNELQKIENLSKEVDKDPSLENGNRLISMYEEYLRSQGYPSICHELRAINIIKADLID